MSDDKKFDFNIAQADGDKPVVIIVREGEAQRINEPVRFKSTVLPRAIGEYIAKRVFSDVAHENRGVILVNVDPDAPKITFMADPTNELAEILEAPLVINPDLIAFRINEQNRGFTQKELEKHVRAYAHCFADVSVAEDLISRLRNFEARYEQIVVQEDNRQGQKKNSWDEAIKLTKGELPKALDLRLPFYNGTDAQNLRVEVEVDRGRDNLPVFSFWSLDLEIKKRAIAEQILSSEVDKYRSKFPILER